VIDFIFPHRLHRLAYFLRLAVMNIMTCFLYSCSSTMNESFWWALAVIIVIYELFFIVLPRIRDIGISKWWLLATLVPVLDIIFGIILLFRRPALMSNRPNSALEPGTTAV
jgi:uncharacterized membrane protein YhaH (DUF805 family)